MHQMMIDIVSMDNSGTCIDMEWGDCKQLFLELLQDPSSDPSSDKPVDPPISKKAELPSDIFKNVELPSEPPCMDVFIL